MYLPRRWRIGLAASLAAAAVLFAAPPVQAAVFTWDGGGGDNNWSTGLNWGGAAPGNPAANDDLVFAGLTRPTPNADAAWTGIQSMDFTGATAAFILGGGAVTLSATGAVTNTTAFNHTINNNLIGGAVALNVVQNAVGNQLTFGGTIDLSAGGGLNITPTGGTAIFNGIISGGAAVTLNAGAGTVQLNGNNTYNGGTVVAGGTLVLGHANAAGTGAVNLNGGNLETDAAGNPVIPNAITVTQDFNLTTTQDAQMSGVVTGAAPRTITKLGAAQLTVTAASLSPAYLGAIVNNAGTLRFDGSTGGDVTNNADMQGVGLIGGNLVNAAGGNLNPGNTPGIINVVGNFTNQTAATLTIELVPGGAAFPLTPGTHFDQVNVGGTATLQLNSITNVVTLNKGYIADGDLFDVIQTFGGVVDAGGLVTDAVNFMGFTGNVVGNAYRLQANRITYTVAADTPNRTEVALGLDSLAAATPQVSNTDAETLLAELDWLGNTAAFRSALDYLSPERYDVIDRVHQRTTQAFIDAQRNILAGRRSGGQLQQSVASGLMAAAPDAAAGAPPPAPAGNPEKTVTMFVQPIGGVIDDDDQSDRTGYDADLVGFLAGIDKQISPTLAGGLMLGYTDANVDYRGLGGDAQIDTLRLGAYVSKSVTPQWYVDGAFSYAYHQHEASRPIIVGVLNRVADAEWDGHDLTLYAETGYDLVPQDKCEVTPFAALAYTWYLQDEYTESGAGAASLVVSDQETHSLSSLLGVRLSKTFGDRVQCTPDVSIGWRHEFVADANDDIGARFVNAPNTFSIDRGDPELDSLNVRAGVTVKLSQNVDINAFYNGDLSSGGQSHSFGAGVSIRF